MVFQFPEYRASPPLDLSDALNALARALRAGARCYNRMNTLHDEVRSALWGREKCQGAHHQPTYTNELQKVRVRSLEGYLGGKGREDWWGRLVVVTRGAPKSLKRTGRSRRRPIPSAATLGCGSPIFCRHLPRSLVRWRYLEVPVITGLGTKDSL